jgi:hypothetical protein
MLDTSDSAQPADRNKKVSAVTVAILVHVGLAILFMFIAVSFSKDADPQIVARVATVKTKTEPKMEKKTVMKQVKQTSSASAASPIARMIRANTVARIAAPEVTKVSDGPLGLGEGDFGDGFGNGSGGGGMGTGTTMFGSRGGGPLIGRLYDMKQNRERNQVGYDGGVGTFFNRVNKAVEKRFSESAMEDLYRAKNRLGFTFLMIPMMSANEGPKAFQAEEEIAPRGWFVHYSGTVSAPESGLWRFLGSFDDCLMVIVDGRKVLDASWDDTSGSPRIREITQVPRFVPSKPIYGGSWVQLDTNTKIEILVGERPGGNMGGVLLVEKKGGNYKKRDDGTPILPVFSTTKLSSADKKRLSDSGYQFAAETPVFRSGASR